ncbi:MAG: alpha/beta hydrolase family protein, partial [Gemmatimonadota bacterium]
MTIAAPPIAVAQEKPTLTPEDYGRWESLGPAVLSPDGAWLAYRVTRVNEEDELRVRRLAEDSTRVVPWGEDPVFAASGRWLAYAIGVSRTERERLEEADEPVRLGTGLLDLESGAERDFDDVAAFAFDAEGRFLALHGYAPDAPEDSAPGGADLRVLDLEAGSSLTLG